MLFDKLDPYILIAPEDIFITRQLAFEDKWSVRFFSGINLSSSFWYGIDKLIDYESQYKAYIGRVPYKSNFKIVLEAIYRRPDYTHYIYKPL